ncbi:MAG: hypothetical protein ACK5LX_04045 [Oscillospiraceae bacterium]
MIISKTALDARKDNPHRRLPYYGIQIRMRFDPSPDKDWYGFQPDVQCMPVYCGKCGRTLSDLYCHCGSRYGHVGEVKCDHCGHEIAVTDGDNIVDRIRFDGEEYHFNSLYKLHWRYLSQVEKNRGVNIREMFADVSRQIPLEDVTKRLEQAVGETTTGRWRYITHSRFDKLPDEVNRWIELLELCGVSGIYLDKKECECPSVGKAKKLPGYPPFY